MSEYKIDSEKYNQKTYLWDGEAEVLIALLAKRIEEIRDIPKHATAKKILELFIRKKENSQVSPTQIMRHVWNQK
jgi:hypothetical protein